jgi:hypothetical protein
MSTFIQFAALPQRDYYAVALVRILFDDLVQRTKARPKKRNIKHEGGACRVLAISLSNGRHAQLVVYDARPDTIEILVETFQMRFAYRSDLEAVAELIDVSVSGFYWIVSDDVVRLR